MIRITLLFAISTSAVAQDWGRYTNDATKVQPPPRAFEIQERRRIDPSIQITIPAHPRYTHGVPVRDYTKRFPEPPRPPVRK